MWRPEVRTGSPSPDCPDLLQHVQVPRTPPTPLYLSFFEEECRAIAARLRLGPASEPSPGSGELSALQPEPAGPATSTPLPFPSHGRVPDSSAGDCEAAATPVPAPRKPGCLPQPAAGGGPGGRPARPSAQSRRARRGPGQPSGGGPGTPARSPSRGRSRLALPRTRASLGLQLPAAGTGRSGWKTRLLRPPGTRLKLTSPAGSRLQHASGASQQAQPSRLPKPAPRDREMKRLATQALLCGRTQEQKENGESKESLVAARILGAGKADQTWVCMESSLSSELVPGLTSGCEHAVPAEQSAGDQLSQELEHVKKELEQVKGELGMWSWLFRGLQDTCNPADKTAQCEAYQETISSLQAQLRAAGICLKDATVLDSGDLGRD